MTANSERIKEIELRREELRTEVREGKADEKRTAEIAKESEELFKELEELRSKSIEVKEAPVMGSNEREMRAKAFVESGRAEFRAVLSSGRIAKPTKVDGINGLPDLTSSIVDDVKAVALTGNGAYTVAYKKTEAIAADVTDGQQIGGTGATFDYVTINPAEWGILDEISNQVAKMSPLDYMGAIEESALIALRAEAENKIVTAVTNSGLLGSMTNVGIDADYLRTVVLGFKAVPGKGPVKLYLNQADLLLLGKVRGTNEKRALYEIAFKPGSQTEGTITEGGLSVAFGITDTLNQGEQLFGQPGTIEMPMWDNYTITTNDGGDYFKRNMIGIRGIQTANAALCAWHGMVKVEN